MRRNIMLACLLSLLTAGMVPCAAQQQQDPSGTVVYSLPMSVVRLQVTCETEQFYAGPYAKFAQKYLGIDARAANSTTHQVTDVKMTPYIEADQGARFTLANSKGCLAFLSMCSQGLVSLGADVPGGTSWRFPSASKADFSDKGVSSNLTSESTVLYRGVRSEAGFNRAAVQQEMVVEKSLETRAKEAADMIFKLRKNRIQILTGDTDATYSGEAMGAAIEEISRLEKEYMSLFCGYSDHSSQTMEFDIVPQASGKTQHYVAFRISDADGLVPADNLAGKPYLMEFIPQAVEVPEPVKASSKAVLVHYRVPATCTVRLSNGVKVLMQSRMPVYQLGVESTFPVDAK